MNQHDSLHALCRVPAALFEGAQESFAELVRSSGVSIDSLSAARLRRVLSQDQALVEDWLSWSSDKRVRSGWYFLKASEGYVVGHHPDAARMVFSDAAAGCAEFIVREVRPYAPKFVAP